MVCFSGGKFCEKMLRVLAVKVVPQATVEEVETHLRSFAVDGVWP